MMQLKKMRTLLLSVLTSALLAPLSALAQDLSDSDSLEITNYELNEARLAKYADASRNLGEIADQLPGNCEDEESPQSLDEFGARLDAIPDVRAAIASAGMTSREYVVFSLSLFQNGLAAWALSQPGGTLPEGMSMANVDFFRKHEATLQESGSLTQSDDCDDADDDDYDDDDYGDDDYDTDDEGR